MKSWAYLSGTHYLAAGADSGTCWFSYRYAMNAVLTKDRMYEGSLDNEKSWSHICASIESNNDEF